MTGISRIAVVVGPGINCCAYAQGSVRKMSNKYTHIIKKYHTKMSNNYKIILEAIIGLSVIMEETKNYLQFTSTSSQSLTLKPQFLIEKCLNGGTLRSYSGIPYCDCLKDFNGSICQFRVYMENFIPINEKYFI
ncbi:hypothetical protein BpHYR1_022387 [Brachionus plicatilis]|uniref:EGF-like domain-containing protein n=1 Tax=Brachionus plicatilis TaxID=10195 RepID=A0A3M7PZ42_BRAPC|nr:hypothetical protein BpHYR1_022387 [Brachionus plicatilis]